MQLSSTPSPQRVAYSYRRISAGALQHKGGGLDRQEAAAREWCERNGCLLDETLNLSDSRISAFRGRNLQGALGRFLALAESGELGPRPVLLVEAVDRLSRLEPLDALSDVFLALVRTGTEIIDLEDGQEYSRQTLNRDPLALVKLSLKVQAAHDYSRRLSTRIRAHWDQSKERARRGEVIRGRGGMKPFWLELDADGRWRFNDRVEIVRLAFELAEHHGTGAIASQLNGRGLLTSTGSKWWASSVSILLRNPAVHGALVLGQKAHAAALAQLRRWEASPTGPPPPPPPEVEVIEDHFPAVVDRATYDRIQRRLAQRATDPTVKAPDGPMRSWLQGLATCQAGGSMTATSEKSRGRVFRYLRCRARRYGGGCRCAGKGWRLEWIHAHVLARMPRLMELLTGHTLQGQGAGEQERLEQQLARAKNQLEAAQGAARKAEQALAAAVDRSVDLSLLERLSQLADQRQQEVARAQAAANDIEAAIGDLQRRPDPAAVLEGEEARELMRAMATGESTPAQRKRFNRLLRQIGFAVVLDDSDRGRPMVQIGLGEFRFPPRPFLGAGEMENLPPAPQPDPAPPTARLIDDGDGGVLIVAE